MTDPIDRYIADLGRELDGLRRSRRDMLREARDGLEDAAEAYAARGLPRPEAAARAVEEFGPVAEVAPAYQIELAAAVTRRALLHLAFLLPAGNVLAWLSWRDDAPMQQAPPPGTMFLSSLVDVIAVVGVIASVAGALACGVGARYVAFRPRFARLAGIGVIAALVETMVFGLALSILFGQARGDDAFELLADPTSLLYWLAYAAIGWLGMRCLRAGRRAERLEPTGARPAYVE